MSTKKKCVCKCGEPESTKRYFTAVVDVIARFGTVNEMPTVEPHIRRYFNEGFVDSPERALALAVDVDNVRFKYPLAKLMENVKFEPEESEYVIHQYFTTNGNVPTNEQMKKFLEGEYAFDHCEFRIQVLETTLVTEDLRKRAVEKIKFRGQ